MKSYLLNNYRTNSLESITSLPTPGYMERFNAIYRNMVNASTFPLAASSSYWDISVDASNPFSTWVNDFNFPQSNILEQSNVDDVRLKALYTNGAVAQATNYKTLLLVPKKIDLEGFNCILLKFNKLDPNVVKLFYGLKNNFNGVQPMLMFHDCLTASIGGTKSIVHTGITPHGTPMNQVSFNITDRHINYEDCSITVSPEEFAAMGFTDRSASPSSQCFHRFVTFFMFSYSSIPYMPISNAIITNAMEVEFNSEVGISYDNKTKTTKNNQGVSFRDISNTVRNVKLSIPNITVDQYLQLDRDFIQKNFNGTFAIIALGNSGAIIPQDYENKRIAGYYELVKEPDIQRDIYNNITVSLEISEVI